MEIQALMVLVMGEATAALMGQAAGVEVMAVGSASPRNLNVVLNQYDHPHVWQHLIPISGHTSFGVAGTWQRVARASDST